MARGRGFSPLPFSVYYSHNIRIYLAIKCIKPYICNMKIDINILKSELKAFLIDCIRSATSDAASKAEYLSINEVCELCKVTRQTLRSWTQKGLIQGFRLNNGRWHYKRVDVIAFMEQQAAKSEKKQAEKAEKKRLWRGFYAQREQAMQDSGRYISVDDFLATLDLAHQRRLLNVKECKKTERNDTY